MASIINADTSNGLKLTSDTSGEIKLQSAGADIVSVTANGMAVDTNTLYIDATNNRVGIGTSSPARPLEVKQSGDSFISITAGNANSSVLELGDSDDINIGRILYNNGSNYLATYTNNAERMRISNDGQVTIGGTGWVGGSTDSGLQIDMNTSTDATFGLIVRNSSNAESFVHKMNGSTYNTTGTFGTLSDQRLKENIVDATPKLDEVKQLKVRNFNLIGEKEKQLGFVAQEIEKVFPNIVDTQAERTHEEIDDEGNVEIVTTPEKKLVKTTVLIPILTKALQEAITKIEDLETRIQALENE